MVRDAPPNAAAGAAKNSTVATRRDFMTAASVQGACSRLRPQGRPPCPDRILTS
jgi:hypothetical protein